MERLRRLTAWLDARRDWCFDLLRVYLGLGLLAKGWLFAARPGLLNEWMDNGRMLAAPPLLAHYVVLAHVCGGLMMAAGLLTRLAAVVQVPILVGAVFFVHMGEGLFTRAQNLEFTLLTLFLLVLVGAHGSGRWSVDYYLFAREREQRERAGHAAERHP